MHLLAQTAYCRVCSKHLLTYSRSCPGWHVLSRMLKNLFVPKFSPTCFYYFFNNEEHGSVLNEVESILFFI